MIWDELIVKNFLSFENFKLKLNNQGIVLVEGKNLTSNKYNSNGSGKCLRGNQRVYDTNTGEYIPVKQFVEEKRSMTLGVTHTRRLMNVKVTDWHDLGKKPIYRVVTSTGSTIEAAATHPLLTDMGCKQIQKLKKGNHVAEVRFKDGVKNLDNSYILWSRVEKIEYVCEDYCYDLTVDSKEHLYVSENFVVHNSSLLEPIIYALYDTTSKGLKGDEVINNKTRKKNNTSVILKGHDGENKYRIERYRKHTKYKNKVKLFINDKDVSEKSTKDTNKKIQRLIGIDYTTFVNSIMFSQGSGAGRFAIATDAEKKEILENIVRLGVYAKAQEVAKSRVQSKEKEIQEKEREVERLQWELSQVDTLEEQDKQQYETTRNMIKQEEENVKKTIDEISAYIHENVTMYNEMEDKINSFTEKLNSLEGIDISEHADRVSKINQAIQQIKSQINQETYKKNDIVKKYAELKNNTHCPVCGSELDPEHRETEMAQLKEQLKPVLINLNELNSKLPQFQEAYEKAYAVYSDVKTQQEEITKKYREYTNEVKKCEQWIRQYENQLQALKNKQKNTTDTLEKLRKVPEPRPRDKERQTIKDKIKAHKDELLALQREKTKLENVVKVYSNSGVKSHVLDLVTPKLNEWGNKHLAVLSGPDMELKFSTQKKKKDGELVDKFDVQLINAAGGDQYKANSEGEKKRADLSIALALQDLVMSKAETATNFVVYDEVFDALDSVGAENVVTLLRERLKTVPTIFVITHNEHLKSLFDKTITIVKGKDAISRIYEGESTS